MFSTGGMPGHNTDTVGLTTEVHIQLCSGALLLYSNSLLKDHSRGTFSCGLKCGQYSKYNIKKAHQKLLHYLPMLNLNLRGFRMGSCANPASSSSSESPPNTPDMVSSLCLLIRGGGCFPGAFDGTEFCCFL